MKNFDVYNLVYMKPFGKNGCFCFSRNIEVIGNSGKRGSISL